MVGDVMNDMELMPEIRWRSSAASTYAAGARTRLHLADPWRWQHSGCHWCHQHNIHWVDAAPGIFIGHPHDELDAHLELVALN